MRVNKQNVLKALPWLKKHNPHFADITTNESNLLQFPVQLVFLCAWDISCHPRDISLSSREILQYSLLYYSYCIALHKLGKTRGSSGSSPPPFFYSGGKTQNLKAKKERKNRWPTELTTIAISVIPNFNAPSRLLAWATIPIALLSNRQLWRRNRMEHIMLHVVSSPELAILRLRQ